MTDIPLIDYTGTDELFLNTANYIAFALNTEPYHPFGGYMDLMNAAKFRPGRCNDMDKAKKIAYHGYSPSPSEIITVKDIFKDVKIVKTNKRVQNLLDSRNFNADEKDFIKKFKNYKSFQDLIDTAYQGDRSNTPQNLVKQAKKREEDLRNTLIAFLTETEAFEKPDNKQNIDAVSNIYELLMIGLKSNMLCSQEFKQEANERIGHFAMAAVASSKDGLFSNGKKGLKNLEKM